MAGSMLTDRELEFVARRRRLVQRWPAVSAVLLAAIALTVGGLYLRTPLLVDPWKTSALLRGGQIPPPTIAEMAIKLPVVFLVCCGLLVALVLFQAAASTTERKLLRLIDRLMERGQGSVC
jgi:hypothetical protein